MRGGSRPPAVNEPAVKLLSGRAARPESGRRGVFPVLALQDPSIMPLSRLGCLKTPNMGKTGYTGATGRKRLRAPGSSDGDGASTIDWEKAR